MPVEIAPAGSGVARYGNPSVSTRSHIVIGEVDAGALDEAFPDELVYVAPGDAHAIHAAATAHRDDSERTFCVWLQPRELAERIAGAIGGARVPHLGNQTLVDLYAIGGVDAIRAAWQQAPYVGNLPSNTVPANDPYTAVPREVADEVDELPELPPELVELDARIGGFSIEDAPRQWQEAYTDALKSDKAKPRYKLSTPAAVAAKIYPPDIVRGVIAANRLAMIYGQSAVGKTFVALDLAASVAEGRPWFGHAVKKCPVVYIALEGTLGIRINAWAEHHGRPFPDGVRIFESADEDAPPFSLGSEADRAALADAIKAEGSGGGLVIIDTLALAMVGMDENSSQDMGIAIAALTAFRKAVGGSVLVVHHAGKDAERGPRGHSALFAALDNVIRVERVSGRLQCSVSKAKDGPNGGVHPFALLRIAFATQSDSEALTSCVVVPSDESEPADEGTPKPRAAKGGNQAIACQVVGDLIRENGIPGKVAAMPSRACIKFEDAVDAVATKLMQYPVRRRKTVARGVLKSDAFCIDGEWVCLS
jgi:hypothetical protein